MRQSAEKAMRMMSEPMDEITRHELQAKHSQEMGKAYIAALNAESTPCRLSW